MITIRTAGIDDAHAIAEVQVNSWRTTYAGIVSEENLRSMKVEDREKKWEWVIQQDAKERIMLVAEDQLGRIVGFASAGPTFHSEYEYEGELYALYLLEEYQRQGIGRRLVSAVMDHFQKVGIRSMLTLALEENTACLFYERMGGRIITRVEVKIGEQILPELVFGWENLNLKG